MSGPVDATGASVPPPDDGPGFDLTQAVGVPDAFDRIWAPHRLAYISGNHKPAGGSAEPSECPFCQIPKRDDEAALVVARGSLVYAVLNLFPYNAGHILVVPFRHIADITELDVAEAAEFIAFTQHAVATLRAATTARGFNLGVNLGAVGGAGIAAHLHQHVVPRWAGDSNFMPIIGRTRVLSQMLSDTRTLLAAAWKDS